MCITHKIIAVKYSLNFIREQIPEKIKITDSNFLGGRDRKDSLKYCKVIWLDAVVRATEADTIYVGKRIPESCDIAKGGGFILQDLCGISDAVEWIKVSNDIEMMMVFNVIVETLQIIAVKLLSVGEAIWEKDGLKQVVQTFSNLCGNPVYVVDSSFKVLALSDNPDMKHMSAVWKNLEEYGYLDYDRIHALVQSNELKKMEASREASLVKSKYFYTPFINANLKYKGRVAGHLFVVGMMKKITESDLELTDFIIPFIQRALSENLSANTFQGTYYQQFLIDLFENKIHDEHYIRRQMETLGFFETEYFVIGLFKLNHGNEFAIERLLHVLESRSYCKTIYYKKKIVAFKKLQSYLGREQLLKECSSLCEENDCIAGLSDIRSVDTNIADSYLQAETALRMKNFCRKDQRVIEYGEIAIYHLLKNFHSEKEMRSFCHPLVFQLAEYDCVHESNYLNTLTVYLQSEQNVQESARRLHIHRNTLTYRIEKMREIFSINLDDFLVRQRLMLSCVLLRNWDHMI